MEQPARRSKLPKLPKLPRSGRRSKSAEPPEDATADPGPPAAAPEPAPAPPPERADAPPSPRRRGRRREAEEQDEHLDWISSLAGGAEPEDSSPGRRRLRQDRDSLDTPDEEEPRPPLHRPYVAPDQPGPRNQ